jgi:segregation and condensation protein B
MPEIIHVLEALLFASDAPVEPERIQEVLDLESADDARALVDELTLALDRRGAALQIVEAGGGFRMVTRPDVAPWLVKLARSRTRSRLSRPALETLAIVAYRQPVSRPEVDAIRGVNSEATLENLLERRMIRIAGRKDTPGRPFLYESTREFLVAFGLRDVSELPTVEGELVVPALDGEGESAPAVGQAELSDAAVGSERSAAHDGPVAPGGASGQDGAHGLAAPREDPRPGGPDLPARG